MGFEFCFTFQCENLNYSHWVCYSHTHLDMLFTQLLERDKYRERRERDLPKTFESSLKRPHLRELKW